MMAGPGLKFAKKEKGYIGRICIDWAALGNHMINASHHEFTPHKFGTGLTLL
jgi:hypothetical protein